MTNRLNLEYLENLNNTTGIISLWIADGERTMRQTPFKEKCTRSYILWKDNYINWVEKMCKIRFNELQELHQSRTKVSERNPYDRDCEIQGPDQVPEYMYFAAHIVLRNSIPNCLMKAQFCNNTSWSLKQKVGFIHDCMTQAFRSNFKQHCDNLIIHDSDSDLAALYKLDYLHSAFKMSRQLEGANIHEHEYFLMQTLCNVLEGSRKYSIVAYEYRRKSMAMPSARNLDAIICVSELTNTLRREADRRLNTEMIMTGRVVGRGKRQTNDEETDERSHKRRVGD